MDQGLQVPLFDGVSVIRWLGLGPSRTRLLNMISKIPTEERMIFMNQCVTPQLAREMALPLNTVDQRNNSVLVAAYFSNTNLLVRHACIAENLLRLLFRVQLFMSNPEPLPASFFPYIITPGIGRQSHEITNALLRFYNSTSEFNSDARPLMFGLLFRLLLSKDTETLEEKWLQPCTDEVALQIWLNPIPEDRTRNDPYDVRRGMAAIAIEWYEQCPILFRRFHEKYEMELTTNKYRPKKATRMFKVDNMLMEEVLQNDPTCTFQIPQRGRRQMILKRWLTIWAFHCLGGMSDAWLYDAERLTVHELVDQAFVICVKRR